MKQILRTVLLIVTGSLVGYFLAKNLTAKQFVHENVIKINKPCKPCGR